MSIAIRSIIQQASNLAQITSEEFSEELDGTRSAGAVIALNNILAQLNLDQLFPYSRVTVEHTVLTSKHEYTIGIDDGISPVIADIPYERPEFINGILYRSSISSARIALNGQPENTALLQMQRDSVGMPNVFSTMGNYPLDSIVFDLKPTSGSILTLVYNKSIPQVGINDTLSIPPSYADLLVPALARRLAVNMPADILSTIDILYKDASHRIKKYNSRFINPLDVVSCDSIASKMTRFYTGRN